MLPHVRARSQHRIMQVLLEVHTLCSECVRQVGNDSGSYYVARYYARLLRQSKAEATMEHTSIIGDQGVMSRPDPDLDAANFLQQLVSLV